MLKKYEILWIQITSLFLNFSSSMHLGIGKNMETFCELNYNKIQIKYYFIKKKE
jgi:hypothetical protein